MTLGYSEAKHLVPRNASSCSVIGKCLTNLDNQEDVRLLNTKDAEKAVNDPLFTKLDPVDDGNMRNALVLSFLLAIAEPTASLRPLYKLSLFSEHYLVHLSKKKVVNDLPVLVAFFVYGYAKLK